MASALASQLQQLREAGAGSKRRTDTFLYDQREAARLDDETVYNLAWNGLLELKQLDARFEELLGDAGVAALFSRQRIHFRRAQILKQDELALNAALQKLLDALSAYFLLGAAHKVLEFLVRRYEVHRYNVDAVMATIVAFHESSWFVRMARILHIHNTRWEFLLAVKTNGTPLLRSALVQRASDESSVIEFLFTTATRIGTSNPKLTSLYTLVVLQMLEQGKVTEHMLRWLVPHLLTALKSTSFPELQSSAYMIVTKLASKATLTDKVVDALVKSLVKHAQSGAQMNALLCVIFLAQTQPSFKLSSGAGTYLVHMENAADFLRDATSSYESAKFVQLLTVFLTQHMKSTDDDYLRLLTTLIESVSVVDEFTEELVETLVEQAEEQDFSMDSERVQAISHVLVALSRKNASKVDTVVNGLLSQQSGKAEEDEKLNMFLTKTFENVANSAHFVPSHTDANTSLALALDHPTEHIRYQALVSLAKLNDTNPEGADKNQVLTSGDVLLRRVLDDSKRIAKFMVTSSLGDLLLSLSTKKRMLDAIVQALRKWSSRGEPSVAEAIADFALKNFRKTASSDVDEKLLTVFVSLITDGNVNKKTTISVDTAWTWISTLDHPFGANVAKASKKSSKTINDIAENFGHALAADVPGLLPYCLGWSQKSELNEEPLTAFLIEVLSAARAQLASKKSRSKKTKEQQVSLDQSFRFVLKKEFASVCEKNVTDVQIEHAVHVASKLSEVSYDVFAVSRDEFDACVSTLLQSPTPIFIRVQECLLNLFYAGLETELLPTMARLVTVAAPTNSVLKVLAKTRALDIISAVLEGFSYSESDKELKPLVHVIPVVMVALSDPSKAVRQSAISCLDRWFVSCDGAVRSSKSANLKVLLKATAFFLKAKQDMLMDSNSVIALCGTYSGQGESSVFHQLLINFVSSASSDEVGIAVKLMELLTPVKETQLWLQSVDFFLQALDGCSTSGANYATTKLLIDFIGHYLDPDVAVMTTKKGKTAVSKEFLDALLAVLCSEKSAVAHLRKLQVFALTNLSPTFYEALDDVSRHVLVDKLLRLLMVADETVASRLIQCLNTLPISFSIFVRLLEDTLASTVEFSALSCILEVLVVKVDSASSTEEADADIRKLLTSLANVLALFCDPKHESVVSEYILQVLFSCLRRVCEVSSSSTIQTNGRPVKTVKHVVADVKPELLVKHTLTCLGRTSSPQTRNEAVLFISSLVNLHPASVLTSLDKILDFVSSGSIRNEDEYSFYVLETIIKAVVPHIIATKNQKAGPLITPQRFIGLFVGAFTQIPKGKREALFEVVVRSLGSELLPYCAVALLQHAAVVKDIDVQRERIQFAHNLCFTFDCSEQVSSLVMVLRMARDLLPHVVEDADTDTDEMDEDEDDVEYERFVLDERLATSNTLSRQFNKLLVKFVTAHLRARELHHKILSYESERDQAVEEEGDMLQHQYLMLAQLDLLYFRRVAREQSLHDDESGFWTTLAAESIEILGALQQLLSTPGFVAVISELLHHDNSLVRKKAMQLFNERLQEERDSLSSGEALLFIDMLDELDSILQNADSSENSVNIQTALLSVDILARNFASDHTKRFQQILPTVVKYVDQDVVNAPPMTLHLFGCAFVCLSSVCRAIGPVVFPLLPKFFPRLLSGIEYCSSTSAVSGSKAVLQCLLASLEVFTSKIPQFLGPYLPSVIRALLTPAVLSTAPSNAEVLLSVDCCFLNLCNHVELRQLLPNLVGAYEHVLTLQSDTSVMRLFSVVGTVVNDLDLPAIRKHLPSFARFFVTALDARRVHASKLQNLDAVEDEVLDCLVQFILKLSEKQLKPLFLKLAEWAQTRVASSGKTGDISRRIAFFKLVVKLSERLRGIFVPYYAHVLEFLTSALRESRKVLMQKPPRSSEDSESEDDDDFFANEDEPPAKKAKLGASATVDVKTERERNTLLLTTVVRALDGCFVHDNDGFIEKDRFDVVLTPLVDVLDVLQYDTSMREFVLETVAPCLANLAWAAKSDLLWKPLHYAVLMKSRGDCAPVRLAALVTVEKCYQVIGDEFLAMLPESIPFLAELMEDTNGEVEKTCHRVIKQIEDISGESLDQYLTN
uniref:HEAT repeat-containing protein 1 n=1 Tax=Phytophthora ramorum TaxID=164328 RepID=H3H1J9_PHYRM